jgi:type IV pilus assembly protein PilP
VKPHNTIRKSLPALLVLSLTGCVGNDMTDLQQQVERIKQTTPGVQLEPPPKLEPYQPFAYAAYGLETPFDEPAFLKEPVEEQRAADGEKFGPVPGRLKELLEDYSLDSLKMVGTINREGLWALMEAPDAVVHRVKIGNYMGTNHGRIISLSEGRVDLIEIVPDGLGGWEQRESFLSISE